MNILQRAAQYIQERALLNEKAGNYRNAVVDLYRYEELLGSIYMSANFYYIREQLEIKAKMYELALKDIEHAITLEPNDIGYKLEQASLLVRVGEIEKALPLLQQLAEEEPNISDIHRLLGICYMRTNKTAAARKSLEKATLGADNGIGVAAAMAIIEDAGSSVSISISLGVLIIIFSSGSLPKIK